MRFILRGTEVDLEPDDVRRAIDGLAPEPIRKYWVRIGPWRYPPKQVLEAALKSKGYEVTRVGFTTSDAFSILKKLGFELGEGR